MRVVFRFAMYATNMPVVRSQLSVLSWLNSDAEPKLPSMITAIKGALKLYYNVGVRPTATMDD